MSPQFHKLVSLGFAFAYAILIQAMIGDNLVFRFFVPAFLIYLVILTCYNWRYLLSQQALNWWLVIRMSLFVLIWFGLLFIIPSSIGRNLYLLFSLPIIFIFETLVANKGQQLGWNIFLLSLASLLIGLYGFNYYFPLSGLLYLILVFAGSTILVRSSIEAVPHPAAIKWFASLILGLFAAQLFWILQFLPLYFSVLAVLSFVILYLLWAIYYHYLYQSLTRRQIQYNLILVIIFTILILISSPWTIQS